MRRNAAFGLAAVALALSAYAQAETWTEGTLSVSWNVQPPAYCEPGISFGASACANYDPNLPEGTEWYWLDSAYSFMWSFTPDGTGSSYSNGGSSSASGSYAGPSDEADDKLLAVNVNFDGHIHVDDGEGGSTLDVDAGPVLLSANLTGWDLKFVDSQGTALPSPLRVGITRRGHVRCKEAKAIVTPGSEAPNVSIDNSGTKNGVISISDLARNGDTWSLTVNGAAASTDPNGDGQITATHKIGGQKKTHPVVVIVPKGIANPKGDERDVDPKNLCVNQDTVPPSPTVPTGCIIRVTVWAIPLTVTVQDQFGKALDGLYDGAEVFETVAGQDFPINQKLSATGTYVDNVGPVTVKPPVLPENDPLAVQWLKDPTLPMQQDQWVDTIAVKIDNSFQLSPGIQNRKVTATPPKHVKIEWQ